MAKECPSLARLFFYRSADYRKSLAAKRSVTSRSPGTRWLITSTAAAPSTIAELMVKSAPVPIATPSATVNVRVTPPSGLSTNASYAIVVADGESTNNGETLGFTTNGTAWTTLDQIPPISGATYPTVTTSGGGLTVTENGIPLRIRVANLDQASAGTFTGAEAG